MRGDCETAIKQLNTAESPMVQAGWQRSVYSFENFTANMCLERYQT